jgi:Ser-tRNA(Ala) deacylase AlaX
MLTVEKVFWQDPYLTELKTKVTSTQDATITLEKTIFYALSGGQESDHGTINGHTVMEARKEDHQIYYRLQPNHGLKVGDAVTIQIDWERRYRLMRLHFAAEIVLELFYKAVSGIEKIGAHIASEKARIDFKWVDTTEVFLTLLTRIQQDANVLIQADSPIISAFENQEIERRYWEIPNFAKVPCGGTHLKRSSEVGPIRLKRDNLGKGKQRVVAFIE